MAVELNSYPTLLNDANLVAYYRFEGNSNDSEGSNNGTPTNVTFGSGYGKFTQGGLFNGSSGKIRLPSTFPDFGTNGFTVSAWVKRAATGAEHSIFQRQDNASHNALTSFYIGTDNKLHCDVRGTEGNVISLTGTTNITDTNWHMVTLTSTGSGGTVAIYLDGSLENSGAIGAATINFGGALPTIGAIYQAWVPFEAWYFNGSIDDVAVFSRALTNTEVLNYYNATPGQTLSVSDTFTLSESNSNLRARLLSITDTFTLSEALSAAKAILLSVSDSIGLSDAIASVRSFRISVSDSFSLSESIANIRARILSVTDTLNVSEAVTAAKALFISVSDTIGLTDAVSYVRTHILSLADTIGLLDLLNTVSPNHWIDKFSRRNTSSNDKYSSRGSTWTDKY